MTMKPIQHLCKSSDVEVCFAADEGWHYRHHLSLPADVNAMVFTQMDGEYTADFELEAPDEDNGGSWSLDWPGYVRIVCEPVSNRRVRQIIEDLVRVIASTENPEALNDELAEAVIRWAWAGAHAQMFGNSDGCRDAINKLVELGARSRRRITPAKPGMPSLSDLNDRLLELRTPQQPLDRFSASSLLRLMRDAAPSCCGLPRYLWSDPTVGPHGHRWVAAGSSMFRSASF